MKTTGGESLRRAEVGGDQNGAKGRSYGAFH